MAEKKIALEVVDYKAVKETLAHTMFFCDICNIKLAARRCTHNKTKQCQNTACMQACVRYGSCLHLEMVMLEVLRGTPKHRRLPGSLYRKVQQAASRCRFLIHVPMDTTQTVSAARKAAVESYQRQMEADIMEATSGR
jgi:hypothetical protein